MQVGKLYQTTGKYSWILFPSCEDAVEWRRRDASSRITLTLPRLHSNQLFVLLETVTLYSYLVCKVLTSEGVVGWIVCNKSDDRRNALVEATEEFVGVGE